MSVPTEDQISMNRYALESVAFASDLSSILVRFAEIDSGGGPLVDEHKEWEISLRDPDNPELRQQVWQIADQLCDVLDQTYAAARQARRS